MRLKDYNYILTIVLFPFIMGLLFLKLSNSLMGDFYTFLIISMIIVFIPSFIMSLYSALDEILHSNKKWRIILLILFSIIYLPIYYTRYVSKGEILFGIMIVILDLIFSYLTYQTFNKKLYNYLLKYYRQTFAISENYVYIAKNGLFKLNVSRDYRCDNNMGDYVVSCDNLEDDSFLGIYSYDVSDYEDEDINDIMDYHINQILNYISEDGYEADIDYANDIVVINYQKMTILLSQNNYFFNDKKYSLIIMKELKSELSNLLDYQKIIESIKFLNYN